MNRVRLDLVGLNGNAFALLGAFRSAANTQGFPEEWIKEVVDEAMSGDYDHLLQTLIAHTD